jgi:hypothetical protein
MNEFQKEIIPILMKQFSKEEAEYIAKFASVLFGDDYIFFSGDNEDIEMFVGEDYLEIWHLKNERRLISKEEFFEILKNFKKTKIEVAIV